jgi:hypothetical protein
MNRLVKFVNQFRRPQSSIVVASKGQVVLVNGVPYAVYFTHLSRIPVYPLKQPN